MFRRPGKSPLEEFEEEAHRSSPYSYGVPKQEEMPPRIFDTPHQSVRTPLPRHEEESSHTIPHHFVEEEEPETTLGEGVTFHGELRFERLLRIDGTFEGELLSQGKVIVGPQGKVKANLNLREAVIEGEVEGNITVQEKLELRGEASVKGDIEAKALSVDEGVQIEGCVTVVRSPKEETPTV